MQTLALLQSLRTSGHIDLDWPATLERPLQRQDIPWSRVEGMLLGLAIGDALGNTSESLLPDVRRRRHGEIRHYPPHRFAHGERRGLPSDDTQLAFFALEERLRTSTFDPDALARKFSSEQIFGLGSSVRSFIRRYKDEGIPWPRAGTDSAGNGALMRIASVIVPYVSAPSPDMWAEAAVNTMLTHNCAAAIGTSVGWTSLLWSLLSSGATHEREAWLDRFAVVCASIEGARSLSPRGGAFMAWNGPLATYVQHVIAHARAHEWSVLEACNQWYSGAYLMETVPSVLYILEHHGHDPEEAIIRAVNDTRDNDTTAAIVGAAVGALHGVDALPLRWRQDLSGRLRANDDGRLHELIDHAAQQWSERR